MPFQLSPGVNVTEVDLTNIVPSVDTSGGAFVGQFHWGPVMDYTHVSDKGRLEFLFGKASDSNYVDWLSAKNFLAYSSNLTLVRVVDEATARNAVAEGTGALIKNRSHYDLVSSTLSSSVFAAKYAGELGNGIQVHLADSTNYTGWAYADEFDGAPATSEWCVSKGAPNANDELHMVVVDSTGEFTGVPGAIVERFPFMSKAKDAKTADGAPNYYGNIVNQQSNFVWHLGAPSAAAYTPEGAVTSISLDAGGSGYTVAPTVSITGTGTNASATAVLSPTGEVVGLNIVNGGTGYSVGDVIQISGDGFGAAAEVSEVAAGVISAIAVTDGGEGYTSATADATGSGNGDAVATVDVGFSVASVTIVDGGEGYDATVSVSFTGDGIGAAASATVSSVGTAWDVKTSVGLQFKTLDSEVSYLLAGGADGIRVGADELIAGWDMFANAEVVDVSLLFMGDAGGQTSSGSVIRHCIDNIAEVRKDVLVFFSPDRIDVFNQTAEQAVENAITFRNVKINRPSSYAIMDSGWKYQYDTHNDAYRWTPLNADIAGLAARTDEVADPWYSPAGYARGQIKNVVQLALNPSKPNRDQLYKNAINPVVSFTGEGTILYGDRTQQLRSAAFSKINIRRLFIVLEKSIARAAKYQLFEFNDEFARSAFRNMVEPFLVQVQSRRGIQDFRIVCDATNNGPEVVDRSEFVGSIFVKPTYSTNFIQLNFVAVRSGVSFDEVVGAV